MFYHFFHRSISKIQNETKRNKLDFRIFPTKKIFPVYLICIKRQSNRVEPHCLPTLKIFLFLPRHNKHRLDLHGAGYNTEIVQVQFNRNAIGRGQGKVDGY